MAARGRITALPGAGPLALVLGIGAPWAFGWHLAWQLSQLDMPTLLIWGQQDTITPPFVGEKFHELIEDSQLVFIDKCGHAPMMEHPDAFNAHLEKFLSEVAAKKEIS